MTRQGQWWFQIAQTLIFSAKIPISTRIWPKPKFVLKDSFWGWAYWFLMTNMTENVSKWPKWPKMAPNNQNDSKWQQWRQNDPKGHKNVKMAQNDPNNQVESKQPKVTQKTRKPQTDTKRTKEVSWQEWTKKCPQMTQSDKNGLEWWLGILVHFCMQCSHWMTNYVSNAHWYTSTQECGKHSVLWERSSPKNCVVWRGNFHLCRRFCIVV